MEYITQNTDVRIEPPPFSEAVAGSSKENFWLVGLKYRITVKATGDVRAVYLYSSSIPGDESNRYTFISVGNGEYYYEEIAGNGATSSAIASGSPNFTEGVRFIFKIKIVGKNVSKCIERRFWVRQPTDLILFGDDKLSYISPYPVLIGTVLLAVACAPNAVNDAGVTKYGGIETVQVMSTIDALSAGDHVVSVPETDVEDLTELRLTDRSASAGIPGFVPPPGSPDFSRYYHFLTFRFRAKRGSLTYRDWPVVLFASKFCKGPQSNYGYDSSGDPLPAPTNPPPFLYLDPSGPTKPPTYPPPTCSSTTYLETQEVLNQYAHDTYVKVYDAATGGNLIGTAKATVTGLRELSIARTAFGSETSQPIAGYYEIVEYGPDRTSEDRYETITYGCATPPKPPTDITRTPPNDPNITTTIDTDFPGRLDDDKTYTIKKYTNKYDTTPVEQWTATVVDTTTLEMEDEDAHDGWWELLEDGIVVGPRIQKSVDAAGCTVCSSTIITNINTGTYTIDYWYGGPAAEYCAWKKIFDFGDYHEIRIELSVYNGAEVYWKLDILERVSYSTTYNGSYRGPTASWVGYPVPTHLYQPNGTYTHLSGDNYWGSTVTVSGGCQP